MDDDVKDYEHRVAPRAVGQRHAALDGLPEDQLLRAEVTDEPGGETVYLQVVIGTGVDGRGEEFVDRTFGIACDVPSGVDTGRAR